VIKLLTQKSILNVLTLGANQNAEITLHAEGEDADVAFEKHVRSKRCIFRRPRIAVENKKRIETL
jgi:phosphotransferase system HPr-like phosphotransfer protein